MDKKRRRRNYVNLICFKTELFKEIVCNSLQTKRENKGNNQVNILDHFLSLSELRYYFFMIIYLFLFLRLKLVIIY